MKILLDPDPAAPAGAPALSTPATVADDALEVAAAAAPFIPNPLAQAIIMLAAQYGPGIIAHIDAVLQKQHITISDIQGIFAGLQPYSVFGIPAVVPLSPVTPLPTGTVTMSPPPTN